MILIREIEDNEEDIIAFGRLSSFFIVFPQFFADKTTLNILIAFMIVKSDKIDDKNNLSSLFVV